MYFDFQDNRPETPSFARPISPREGALLSIIFHLLVVIGLLVAPNLPIVREAEERRQQALEELRRQQLERMRQNARFVFVQPRVDTPAPQPKPDADLSDMDRQARSVERAPLGNTALPFSRGNTPERVEAERAARLNRPPGAGASPPAPAPSVPDGLNGLPRPDAPPATEPRAVERTAEPDTFNPSVGVIADAIRNVRKYVEQDQLMSLSGTQDFAPSIQFDTKGVEFGPWLRRFIAQIRRNWFVPYAAMSLRGHVVITFNVHKDGRITDVAVAKPSAVDGFTSSARNAILSSNPTMPLPPEYPEDRAFFTVTFYFNESPDR